jgi:hypothetical protein
MADYTTLADVKLLMGITTSDKDALITKLIPFVTTLFNNAWDRELRETTYTDQKYHGTGNELLRLEQWPMKTGGAVTVKVDDVTIDAATYDVDLVPALLTRTNVTGLSFISRQLPIWLVGVNNIKVTYTAGYASGSIPGDIQMAAAYMVGNLVENAGAIAGGFLSERIGNYSYKKGDASEQEGAKAAIPPQVWGMISNYERTEFSAQRADL